jgi:hypothetical protein
MPPWSGDRSRHRKPTDAASEDTLDHSRSHLKTTTQFRVPAEDASRVTNALAFQAADFETFTVRYEIPPSNEKAIWSGMHDKTRNAIRNGEKLHQITDTLDPDSFIDFYRRNALDCHKTCFRQLQDF